MKTYEKCFPCFERQTSDACALAGLPPSGQARVLTEVRKKIGSFPRDHSPVEMARDIHQLVRSASGAGDPYASIKHESNEVCRSCMPRFYEHLAESKDPLSTALKLAIAGNVLDFGVYSVSRVFRRDLLKTVDMILSQPLSGDDADAFRNVVEQAKAILYIGDNAGECFFDRLLLERLPSHKLTYAVRGEPILNDATVEDAQAAGIPDVCRVIDTGDHAPGVVLASCSDTFRKSFEQSDLVIAKGQGNYESLSGRTDRTYAFVTKVKCDVIARDIGFAVGSNVIRIVRLGSRTWGDSAKPLPPGEPPRPLESRGKQGRREPRMNANRREWEEKTTDSSTKRADEKEEREVQHA